MGTARIYKKGRVTIPKAVREATGLDVGDRVVVEARSGEIVVRRPRGVLDFEPPQTGSVALPWLEARHAAREERAARRAAHVRGWRRRETPPSSSSCWPRPHWRWPACSRATRAGFGWDRHSVAEAVEAVVDEPAFAVEHGSVLRAAAATCRERSIDLHDCFLAAVAVERGTRVLSLDDDLRRLGAAERPQDLTRR